VRHAERFLNSLNPPKPERESKRKKKKPINKDFVDFSQDQGIEEPVSTKLNPAAVACIYHTCPWRKECRIVSTFSTLIQE
jgi:hypothetical protein